MQVVLLAAGVGSPAEEPGTGLLLLALTVFNAVLGLRQEGKAAAAGARGARLGRQAQPVAGGMRLGLGVSHELCVEVTNGPDRSACGPLMVRWRN
jgi:hypothetical protein